MASNRNYANIQRLIDDHLDAVYRYARRLNGTVHDAEDLTQQVFMLAQERMDQLCEADSARGWLFTILRNSFLKWCSGRSPFPRKRGHEPRVSAGGKGKRPGHGYAELQAAIDELPAEFRVVVVMFYFEECSYREIAEKLDLPIGTGNQPGAREGQRPLLADEVV